MTPIRIGLLGTGYMALKAYLPSLRRQGAVVQALWGRNPQSAAQLAESLGIPKAYASQEELIFDPQIDAVIIATPNALHAEALKAAAAAQKAVACEKPLGMNLAEALKMYSAAVEAGIPHAVPYLWRLPDLAQQIKAEIENGFLGRALEFHAVFTAAFLASPQASMGWRGKRELAGAGVLADLGGHLSDLGYRFIGEISQVVAQGTTHIPLRPISPEKSETVTVIDSCNALLKFKNGAQGSLQMSFVNLARNMLVRAEIHGSQGALLYELEMKSDLLHTRLGRARLNHEDQIEWESKVQPFAEIVDRFCAGFLQRIRGEPSDLPDLADGVRGQAVIEAAARSLKSDCWEAVELEGLSAC